MSTSLNAALDFVLGAAETPARPAPRPGPPPAALHGLVQVALADLQPSESNPREALTDIAELAESIRENGLIQPIIARRTDRGLVIVAGHRRLAALQRLGRMSCEVIVRKDMAPDDELAAMLVENGQRAGLDPIEEARAMNRLKALGDLSDRELGAKIGRSQAVVSGRLALLALSPDEQEQVRAGTTSLTEATHVARVNAGKVMATPKNGHARGWALGPQHSLAKNAKARCQRLNHGRGRSVGGMACGECWESVIRSDERQHLQQHLAERGTCGICGTTTT